MASRALKIVFIAAHTAARDALLKTCASKHTLSLLITLPPEKGAAKSGYYSFLAERKKHRIPTMEVKTIHEPAVLERVRAIQPDLLVVLGWSELLKPDLLSIPSIGAIGAHTSMLPKNRGRSPLNWAIINGDKKGGVTLFFLTPESDTGLILSQQAFPITQKDDIATLYAKAEKAIGTMLSKILRAPNVPKGKKQNDALSSYLPRRRKADGLLDFNASAQNCYDLVRALTPPYPGAYFYFRGQPIVVVKASVIQAGKNKSKGIKKSLKSTPGQVIQITSQGVSVQCDKGILQLQSLQQEGQRPVPASRLAKALGITVGTVLQGTKDYPGILEYYFRDAHGGTKKFPTNIPANSPAEVSLILRNHFTTPLTLRSTISVDGLVVDTKDTTLPPQSQRLQQFSFSVQKGSHNVEVQSTCLNNPAALGTQQTRSDSLVVWGA